MVCNLQIGTESEQIHGRFFKFGNPAAPPFWSRPRLLIWILSQRKTKESAELT